MSIYSIDIFEIIGNVFLVIGLITGIIHRNLLAKSFKLIAPYTILGIIFTLGLSASYTLGDVSLDDNLKLIFINSYQIIRNSFLASIGIIFFRLIGSKEIICHWEKSFSFIKYIPAWFIPIIILSNIIYSWFIYSIFGVEFFDFSSSLVERLQNITVGCLGAVAEELLIRLFLIGFLVYLLRNLQYKWFVAILISSFYWALLHQVNGMIDIMKVVQIIPFGLVIGYTMKKYGFEASLAIHLVSNIFLMSM